ncbi:MAG: S8 family serine peptidase [Burkholderiaceae bacterium]
MNLLAPFIVLIERRVSLRHWFPLRSLLTLALVSGLINPLAHAQTGSNKIARDLQPVLTAATTPLINWAKDVNGVRYVKVLIVSNSDDAALTTLRAAVMAAGGSIYYRYSSVLALAALLPANQVGAIAARSDVQSISPNRLMTRSASMIESVTGTAAIRTTGTTNYNGTNGVTGNGIGIAVLDSGISWQHADFLGDGGASRVRESISFTKAGDAVRAGVTDWKTGIDVSGVLYPGSPTMMTYLANLQNGFAPKADRFGHGSHVAAVAAGRGAYQSVDTTGIAPNANLFDVRVLDDNGYGQLSDVLAGIDWVIYYGKFKNIRVINLSLGADSTESYQTDPLARAVRSAVAQGIVVVVAGGNYGLNAAGKEAYGTISSPGDEPSVITVGSVNTKGSIGRGDDVVNNFSSRGPTRGSLLDANGVRQYDNVLKPDLVAPGNKIVSAMAQDTAGAGGARNLLVTRYPALAQVGGVAQTQDKALMLLSGTSIAAPVVSGAVALMLEANQGLTPAMVKAILQYTAQTLPNANLVQQGAGALNIDGAVRLAGAIRNDMAQRITAGGTIAAGESLLWWSGATLPAPSSVINGETVPWGRLVFVGGNRIVTGEALFKQWQPAFDPRLLWVGNSVKQLTVRYWPNTNNVYPMAVQATAAANSTLLTAGVVSLGELAGTSSWVGKTGIFLPSARLASWLSSGKTLTQGIVLSERVVLSEGLVLGEGLVLSERVVLSERIVLSEGLVLSEGIVLSEAGTTNPANAREKTVTGEP